MRMGFALLGTIILMACSPLRRPSRTELSSLVEHGRLRLYDELNSLIRSRFLQTDNPVAAQFDLVEILRDKVRLASRKDLETLKSTLGSIVQSGFKTEQKGIEPNAANLTILNFAMDEFAEALSTGCVSNKSRLPINPQMSRILKVLCAEKTSVEVQDATLEELWLTVLGGLETSEQDIPSWKKMMSEELARSPLRDKGLVVREIFRSLLMHPAFLLQV